MRPGNSFRSGWSSSGNRSNGRVRPCRDRAGGGNLGAERRNILLLERFLRSSNCAIFSCTVRCAFMISIARSSACPTRSRIAWSISRSVSSLNSRGPSGANERFRTKRENALSNWEMQRGQSVETALRTTHAGASLQSGVEDATDTWQSGAETAARIAQRSME